MKRKKYMTVTEACNYLLQNTVKGVTYNSETSEMTITYNREDEVVTEKFTVGGGDTSELEQAIENLEQDLGDAKDDITAIKTNLNSSLTIKASDIYSNVVINENLFCTVNSDSNDDIIQWSPNPSDMAKCASAGLYALNRTAEDLSAGRIRFALLNADYDIRNNPIRINIVIYKQNNIV